MTVAHETKTVLSQRAIDALEIMEAYRTVEESLRIAGKLLRTTYAGEFMWATDHKSTITGLRIVMEKLRDDVPSYSEDVANHK